MTLDEMKRRLRDDSEAWRAWTEDPATAAEVATLVAVTEATAGRKAADALMGF